MAWAARGDPIKVVREPAVLGAHQAWAVARAVEVVEADGAEAGADEGSKS